MDAEALEAGSRVALSDVWSDYDGDAIYGDFEIDGGGPVDVRSFEPGLGTVDWLGGQPDTSTAKYYHTNMIGTTRFMSDAAGSKVDPGVYTAFGERIDGTNHRYGYAGAWGYQAHDEMPFLHVGHRYYDPATGRFLQRDPIGIAGGLNVYEYVRSRPTVRTDPFGLRRWREVTGTRRVGRPSGWQRQDRYTTYDDEDARDYATFVGAEGALFGLVMFLVPEPVTTIAGGFALICGGGATALAVRDPIVVDREWVDTGPVEPYGPGGPPLL